MSLLVLLAQQVIDGLHGIEGGKGYFHEYRTPVTHGSVPQTGKLQCLQFFSSLTLTADETGGLVNK